MYTARLQPYICKYTHTILPTTPNDLIDEVAKEIMTYEQWSNHGTGPFLSRLPIKKIRQLNTDTLSQIVQMDSMSFKCIGVNRRRC